MNYKKMSVLLFMLLGFAFSGLFFGENQLNAQQMKSAEFEKLIAEIRMQRNEVPIGTIVASVLEPKLFFQFNSDKIWAKADGTTTPPESAFYKLGLDNNKKLPDLRGVFLRGINDYGQGTADIGREMGDSDGIRRPGSYQADLIEKHEHSIDPYTLLHSQERAAGRSVWENPTPPQPGTRVICGDAVSKIQPFGGAETRPKNVAVYHYIKINYSNNVFFENGTASTTSPSRTWEVDSNGVRTKRVKVFFKVPFPDKPKIMVGVSGWDGSDIVNSVNRMNVSVGYVSPDLFEVVFTTWYTTEIVSATVNWLAYLVP